MEPFHKFLRYYSDILNTWVDIILRKETSMNEKPKECFPHYKKAFSLIALFATLSSTVAYCENKSAFSLIFSGGANFGGIEPKKPMKPLDAVSGASKWGGTGGVHAEIGIAGHFIETGLDYSYYKNDLTYKDAEKNIDGTRSFAVQGIALPITYNFHFFKRSGGDPGLIVGLGFLGSYFPYQETKETGTLSGYNSKNWAAGPILRVSYYPLEIEGKYLPGLYLGLFRSLSRIYTDDYYKDSKAGDLGILDMGINLKIKT
jgi:hypothetical protein